MIRKFLPKAFLFLYLNIGAQSDSLRIVADSLYTNYSIPLFNTEGEEGETQLEQQDVSPLLQSSRDIFAQFASFQFGAARYKMRGYAGRNQSIYINGIPVNSPETGLATWSSWGGLNDVTRYTETRFGITSNPFGFSGTGGYVNIDSKASSFKKSTRFSYASTNRIYRNRLMFSHSSGLTSKGWAYTFSGSVRSGEEVKIAGTYYRAAAFYISIDKQLNKKNLLSFTGFTAPLEQGRTSAATLEVYELTQNNYYNSNWGLQNGKVRNANISRNSRPTLILNHTYNINESSELTSAVSYYFGKSGNAGLTWYDAPNPKPDYYRYLPSYYYGSGDTVLGNSILDLWSNNENVQQINWDRLIAMNQANLYTDPHVLGQGANTSETRARYIVENRIDNLKNITVNTVYTKRMNRLNLNVGMNASIYKNRKYKELEDLLGADFWIDVDQFAENLGVEESIQQNDIDNPNKKVKEGDRFGYDYCININKAECCQTEYVVKKFDLYFGASLTGTEIWREGYIANGKFPNTSKGKSEKLRYINGGLKAGAIFKLTGRQFFSLNTLFQKRNPEFNSVFISPRVRNDLVKDLQNEEVYSGDLSYHLKYPNLKLRCAYYFTQINHQTWLRTYWHDSYNTNVNLIMKNLNQTYQGIELGFEKTYLAAHVLQGAAAFSQNIYSNRPTLEAWQDNNNTALYENRSTYLKNYRIGASPQLVAGLGYKYMGKKYWFAGIYGNFIDQLYVEPNPDRRTKEAIGKYQENESALTEEIILQERLPSYFILNANAAKSFRLHKKYFLNLNFSINNLLNTRQSISSGFESLRWDESNVLKFPNKYYYMNGISYMLIINCSF